MSRGSRQTLKKRCDIEAETSGQKQILAYQLASCLLAIVDSSVSTTSRKQWRVHEPSKIVHFRFTSRDIIEIGKLILSLWSFWVYEEYGCFRHKMTIEAKWIK